MLGYRPLVYFWIAEYTNGSALPQFDPETGKENRFSEIDHRKLHRFGWYPFSPKLAQQILKAEKMVVIPSRNRSYTVIVEKGDRLVATWVGNTLEYHILKSTEPVEIEPVEVSILHQPVG